MEEVVVVVVEVVVVVVVVVVVIVVTNTIIITNFVTFLDCVLGDKLLQSSCCVLTFALTKRAHT